MGYLDHPHTSAGRLPTDEGYRFCVDWLMAHPPLSAHDAATVSAGLNAPDGSPHTGAAECLAAALARMSRHVGFVLFPGHSHTTFLHIDLVRLPHPRVLVVLVSAGGHYPEGLSVADELTQDDLQECANYLNTNFTGQNLGSIRARLLELMREEKALYDSLLQRVVSLGEQAFRSDVTSGQVYLDGTSNIVGQPEFDDLGRMRAIFKTFEERGRLLKILNACILGEASASLSAMRTPTPTCTTWH